MIEQRLSEDTLKLWIAVHWITSLALIILAVAIWILVSIFEGSVPGLLIIPGVLFVISIFIHAYLKVFWRKFKFF